MQAPPTNLERIEARIRASAEKAERITERLRRLNQGYLIASITSSGVSTLVAGLTAAQGPVVGSGIEGWRVACLVAALFAFISTVVTLLNQQMKISDRLAEGTRCVGRLRALDVMLLMGHQDWQKITGEYEDIVRAHPDFVV
ncbi:MAG: hypothetical protein KDD73_09520 [Anaerolineales bacterium]|nr:hypothetical protein [Anaerolineales bacterium]MCB9126429.1 hypothetical protein [Ardenticatenales bacterium]MCB9171590.1 hypothetical protein [Ardenticatenales bacterium]